MARRDKKTAYILVAIGLIIVVTALSCMMINSDDKICGKKRAARRKSRSRIGEPRVFAPTSSCKIGYDYNIYSNTGCLPYMANYSNY